LGNSGVGGLLGSDGVVDDVVSAVDDLIDDLFDGEIEISICVGLDCSKTIYITISMQEAKIILFCMDLLADQKESPLVVARKLEKECYAFYALGEDKGIPNQHTFA
jgi:hypothetical protein